VFWDGTKIQSSEGFLFEKLKLRHQGFAAQSAATAAAIAIHSDQLVCIPSLVAADQVKLGRLCEINFRDLEPPLAPFFLWTHVTKVHAHIQKRIKANLSRVLL
jgi:hypothetical protein